MNYLRVLSNKIKIIKINSITNLSKSWRIKKYLLKNATCKLNIGCGTNILSDWLNTDLIPGALNIIPLDATKKFPFSNESFDFVFSEHMVEHLEYYQALFFFRECHRIMKKNAVIRIATPDLNFLLDLFRPSVTDLQEKYIKYFLSRYWTKDVILNNPGYIINSYFYKWGHKFIYNRAILEHMLLETGYHNFKWCYPGESIHQELKSIEGHQKLISKEFNDLETMVIEAECYKL